MKSFFRQYFWNFLLIIGFTALALWYALKDDLPEVLQTVFTVSPWRLTALLGASLLVQGINGWGLQQLARPTDPRYSLKDGFLNAVVGSLFHGITPGASGGQISQVYVFYKQGIPGGAAAGILVVEFIVYELVSISVSGVMMLTRFRYFADNSFFYVSLAGYLLTLFLVAVLVVCANSRKAYNWISRMGLKAGVKLRLIRHPEKARDNLEEKVESYAREMALIRRDHTLLARIVAADAVRISILLLIPAMAAWVMEIPIPEGDLWTIAAMTSFVLNVNMFIPVPGASGGTESTFVVMFSQIMPKAQASSIMVLWRFATYHFILIIGAMLFVGVERMPRRPKAAREAAVQADAAGNLERRR